MWGDFMSRDSHPSKYGIISPDEPDEKRKDIYIYVYVCIYIIDR